MKRFDVFLVAGEKRTLSCTRCVIRGSWVLFYNGEVIVTAFPQHAVREINQIKPPRKPKGMKLA